MSSLTDEIVGFLLDEGAPPLDVRAKAVEHIVDGIAVMLAGSRTDCAGKLVGFVRDRGGKPASTVIGFGFKSSPSDAAMVNGTSGHADDYDDTQLSTSPDRVYGLMTHPTVPVLAAALESGRLWGVLVVISWMLLSRVSRRSVRLWKRLNPIITGGVSTRRGR